MRRRGWTAVATAFVAATIAAGPCLAAKPGARPEVAGTAPKPTVAPPVPEGTAPAASDERPYDAALLRLAGKLGALTIVQGVCGAKEAGDWRLRMQALLDAEGEDPQRRDRLAGAYNDGLRGYALSYRSCTPNARLVMRRLLDETGRLARDIAGRYRPS